MAIKYFKQVIKYVPNNAETHCNIGKAFLNLDETSKAKIYFEKTLELNPHDAEAHCNLGKLYLDEHFSKLLEIKKFTEQNSTGYLILAFIPPTNPAALIT